jgi:hypothetical protein
MLKNKIFFYYQSIFYILKIYGIDLDFSGEAFESVSELFLDYTGYSSIQGLNYIFLSYQVLIFFLMTS